jgi:hypothetical protein
MMVSGTLSLSCIFAFSAAAFVGDRSGDLDWPWTARVLSAVAVFCAIFALVFVGWPHLVFWLNRL